MEEQLTAAGTYWVVAPTQGHPHPRPVWGLWSDHRLYLSIGSPTLLRALQGAVPISVHLGSDTDVVIVEGLTDPLSRPTPHPLIESYNAKYDWDYQVAEYGELTTVEPTKVMAWRSAGWAGREGFTATGCWLLDPPD